MTHGPIWLARHADRGKFIAKTRSGRPTKLRRAIKIWRWRIFTAARRRFDTGCRALWNMAPAARACRQSQFWRACVHWGWPVKQRCFAQRRASIPIKAAFSRWGYCAPPLAACISYASRSPQKPSALPPPILPRPDHARTAPEQPTAHRRSAAVSATGINRRARRSGSGLSAGHPPRVAALPRIAGAGARSELALLDTLLLLMSLNGDTNVASRGGRTVCAGYSSRLRSYYSRAAYGRLTISFISTGSISNALNAISAGR